MKNLVLFVIIASAICSSCAPVFSDLQSAKLAGKGNIEATPNFTSTGFSEDGESDHIQNHYGLQLGYGISDWLDIRVRYEYVGINDELLMGESFPVNVLGIGPKFSLIQNRVAAYIPVGFAFGKEIDKEDIEIEVQPTLLFTIPVGEKIEINPSVKGIIAEEFYLAFNLGLGLSTNPDIYMIRPEYGILINPGESGRFGQFSIGLSVYPLKKRESK